MPTIHTALPQDRVGHHGEFVVGKILEKFSNPGLELWFDVNYIAGVTDLDLILMDNQVGLYIIEIKSVPLDSIETFTMTDFLLKERQLRQHPKSQLLTASIKLRDYLNRFPKFKECHSFKQQFYGQRLREKNGKLDLTIQLYPVLKKCVFLKMT